MESSLQSLDYQLVKTSLIYLSVRLKLLASIVLLSRGKYEMVGKKGHSLFSWDADDLFMPSKL